MRRLLLPPLLLLGMALPTTAAYAHDEEPVECKTANRANFEPGVAHVRVRLTCINPSQRYDYVVKVVVRVTTPVDHRRQKLRIAIGSIDTEVRVFNVNLRPQGTQVASEPVHIHNLARSG